MKALWLIITAASFTAVLLAQTNLPLLSAAGPETYIDSNSLESDFKTRVVIFRGNVRVNDLKMRLTCEVLTAQFELGGRIGNIVAETNVLVDVIDENGQTNRATGDRLVYPKVENGVTNDVAVLTGNPRLERPEFSVTGDSVEWNRTTGEINVSNPHVVPKAVAGGNTNLFPASLKSTNHEAD